MHLFLRKRFRKIYDGSESKLFAALLKKHKVEEKEIAKLKDIIEKWD